LNEANASNQTGRSALCPYDPMENSKHRSTIRLKEYDYTQTTGYFVTICTTNKLPLFGSIVDDKIQLNREGCIVREEWLKTATLRANVSLDEFIVMPDHIHGIILLTDDSRETARCTFPHSNSAVSKTNVAPLNVTNRVFGQMISGSLSSIVRAFKSAVSRQINLLRNTPGAPIWQRNYYEHVIRNEDDLENTRRYIKYNLQKISY